VEDRRGFLAFLPSSDKSDVPCDGRGEIEGFPVQQPAGEFVAVAFRGAGVDGGRAVGDGLRLDGAATGAVECDRVGDGCGRLVLLPSRRQGQITGDGRGEIERPAVQ